MAGSFVSVQRSIRASAWVVSLNFRQGFENLQSWFRDVAQPCSHQMLLSQ